MNIISPAIGLTDHCCTLSNPLSTTVRPLDTMAQSLTGCVRIRSKVTPLHPRSYRWAQGSNRRTWTTLFFTTSWYASNASQKFLSEHTYIELRLQLLRMTVPKNQKQHFSQFHPMCTTWGATRARTFLAHVFWALVCRWIPGPFAIT